MCMGKWGRSLFVWLKRMDNLSIILRLRPHYWLVLNWWEYQLRTVFFRWGLWQNNELCTCPPINLGFIGKGHEWPENVMIQSMRKEFWPCIQMVYTIHIIVWVQMQTSQDLITVQSGITSLHISASYIIWFTILTNLFLDIRFPTSCVPLFPNKRR